MKRFKQTIATLKDLPKSEWPARMMTKRRKRDKEFDRRVDAMIAARNTTAKDLGIDGSLIASRAAIESIAADEAQPSELLMKWQVGLLGL